MSPRLFKGSSLSVVVAKAAVAANDFSTCQTDVWAGGGGELVDPDGGLDDDYDGVLVTSRGDGAWDDADVF